jgi:hypothetical protein
MKKGALYIDIKICDSVSSASHDDFARVYALNKAEEALKDIVLKGNTKRDSTTEAKLKAEEDLEGPGLSVRIRERLTHRQRIVARKRKCYKPTARWLHTHIASRSPAPRRGSSLNIHEYTIFPATSLWDAHDSRLHHKQRERPRRFRAGTGIRKHRSTGSDGHTRCHQQTARFG